MIVRHSEEIVRFVCQCDKCGHSWTSREHRVRVDGVEMLAFPLVPSKVCPKCKSRSWNEPKYYDADRDADAPGDQGEQDAKDDARFVYADDHRTPPRADY